MEYTFYKTQIRYLFNIFCMCSTVYSTVTKTGWLCYYNIVTKLCFASVRICDCKRLSAHNFVNFCLRRPQLPARCCDVDHRHDVGRPVSHAKCYADEMSYSRRSPSLRWTSLWTTTDQPLLSNAPRISS